MPATGLSGIAYTHTLVSKIIKAVIQALNSALPPGTRFFNTRHWKWPFP
jgi:hypothetical protein